MIFGVHLSVALLTALGLASDALVGVHAAPSRRAPALARVVRSCTEDNVAALTFDDGPYQYTNDAVRILGAKGAKGTFFVNGDNWGCIYDQSSVDAMNNAFHHGHQIASHTWAHKDLTALSFDQIEQEMTRSHVAIERITGASVAFMRPPYGNFNDNVRQVAENLGETVVIWDLDSGDSTGASLEQQKAQYSDAASRHPKNILSLQHDVHSDSINKVLPYAIDQLQGAGYRLVTLAECLGEGPYQKVGSPQSRTSDWHC